MVMKVVVGDLEARKVEGYGDKYLVTSCGKIYSLLNSKFLKPQKSRKGYLFVNLSYKSKCFRVPIHRLVAKAFLDNPNNYPCVNHKDENKENNNFLNLEWCTWQYNKEYSSSKTVNLIDPNGNSLEVFNLNRFARENGLSYGCLCLVLSGKRKHHKGWRAKL